MSVRVRLTVFALVALAALAGGAAVGEAVGPIDTGPSPVPADHIDHGETSP